MFRKKKSGWLEIATLAGAVAITFGAFELLEPGQPAPAPLLIPAPTPTIVPTPAPTPPVSITDMAGYHEGPYTDALFSSSPLVTPSQWASYQDARGDLATSIANMRSEGIESKRVQDWFALIDTLKTINDPLTEGELADAWVNSNIVFSGTDTDNSASAPQGGRPQTPFETLTYGTGNTADTAVLKYETLRMAGVSSDDMRLVASADDMALMLDVAGQNWVFYTWSNPDIPDYKSYHDPATQEADFLANSYPMQDQAFAAHNQFTPLAAMNEAGFQSYYQDSTKPVELPNPTGFALTARVQALSSDMQNAIGTIATAVFEDSRNNKDNPEVRVDQFDGFQEIPGQGAQVDPPDANEWPYYVQNRGNLDQAIQNCLAAPGSCDARFKAWVDLIDLLQSIDDDKTKIVIVQAWVNSVIEYNDAKGAINSTDDPRYSAATWMQSPQETLRLGSGVCVDFATLKYETLRLAGIDPMRMRLVASEDHMVLMIDTDDTNWVLSNWEPPMVPQQDQDADDQRSDNLLAFADNVNLEPDDQYMPEQRFSPTDSLNEYGDWAYDNDTKTSLPHVPDVHIDPASLMRNLPPAQSAALDRVIAEAFALSRNNPNATNAPIPTPAPPVYMAGLYATPASNVSLAP